VPNHRHSPAANCPIYVSQPATNSTHINTGKGSKLTASIYIKARKPLRTVPFQLPSAYLAPDPSFPKISRPCCLSLNCSWSIRSRAIIFMDQTPSSCKNRKRWLASESDAPPHVFLKWTTASGGRVGPLVSAISRAHAAGRSAKRKLVAKSAKALGNAGLAGEAQGGGFGCRDDLRSIDIPSQTSKRHRFITPE
jgi:hypothetical protein